MSILKDRWNALLEEEPKLRIRNAAEKLGVSELALLQTDLGNGVTRLKDDFRAILAEMHRVGEVMALTRNASCVHEKKGVYNNVSFMKQHGMGLVLDDAIDLRLFMNAWAHGYVVEVPFDGGIGGLRRSFQFFDKHGQAVHKIYMTRPSNLDAYAELVAEFTHEDQVAVELEPAIAKEAFTFGEGSWPFAPGSEEHAAFLSDWDELQDTHDFFPLLRKHGVSRPHALEMAEGRHTERVDNVSSRRMLDLASEAGLPIMAFVGNDGCIQIHTGEVKKVKEYGPWYNVLDPGFNLHLKEEAIRHSWVVRKPTEDGVVTALEVLGEDGEIIVQFFGKRKPGIPELSEWQDLVATLPRLEAVEA